MKRRSPRLAAAATAKEPDQAVVALMDLPHELLVLVAPVHAGMALIRMGAACHAWCGMIIDDGLWKTAALLRFPRLIPLLALEARRPPVLQEPNPNPNPDP